MTQANIGVYTVYHISHNIAEIIIIHFSVLQTEISKISEEERVLCFQKLMREVTESKKNNTFETGKKPTATKEKKNRILPSESYLS